MANLELSATLQRAKQYPWEGTALRMHSRRCAALNQLATFDMPSLESMLRLPHYRPAL